MQGLHDRDDTLEQILGCATSILGADRADFALWDETKGDLIIVAVCGLSSKKTLKRGDPLPKQCFMRTLWDDRKARVRRTRNVMNEGENYYSAHSDIKSALAVTFELAGQRIGIMNVESVVEGHFKKEAEEPLRLLARYGALAVRSAEEKSSHSEILQHLGEDFNSERPTLNGILEAVQRFYGFDCGLIFFADHEKKRLFCCNSMGCKGSEFDPLQFSYSFDEKQSIAANTFNNQESYFRRNPGSDAFADERGLKALDIRGPLIAIPLYLGAKVKGKRTRIEGILEVWSRKAPPRVKRTWNG